MIQWGITKGSHDAALAVFDDHRLLFASDAERFSKKKNDSEIPSSLIQHAEEKYGIPKKVYFYENPFIKSTRRIWANQKPSFVRPKFKYKLIYTNHHESHAAYGYYSSPFDECTILVIDAIGEWDTLTTWKAKGGKLKRSGKGWKYPKSLGLFYSAITQAAGWKPNEEEYIMMGASAIGKTTPVCYKKLKFLWDNDFNFHQGVHLVKRGLDKMELASCAQDLYEEIFKEIISDLEGNVVFVGGCALNVKANALLEHCNVFIPSNPGDAGSAIGCVLARTKRKIDPTPYLGYEIEGEYPVDEIVKSLKKHKIVGIAKGKAEFGPRALGNRSLLADPSILDIKDRVNKIKGREEFRPFAPMILKEDVDTYFKGGLYSPYMSSIKLATHQTQKLYPGIVHVDGTSRVQVVEKGVHRELLETWKEKTKCPILLNTSLNIKGKPIVNDEVDVIEFEKTTGVKVL